MTDEALIFLAILGEADAATLTAVSSLSPDVWRGDERVRVVNGRFRLDPTHAADLLRQLSQNDPARYCRLHEQVYAELARQIANGQQENEGGWTAVFERLANLYFAGDTPALLQLVQQAAELPLQSQAARQTRAYFQGVAAFRQDDYEAALRHFDELLAQDNLPLHLQARTLNARAVVCRVTGQLEEAMAGYQESLALWQTLGDTHYQGIVNLNLGIIAYGLRRYGEAAEHLRQAGHFFRQAGSAVWLRKVQSELGLVQRDLGQWDEALAYFDAYVAQSRQAGAEEDVGVGEANRGEVLLFKGDLAGAKAALQAALHLLVSRTYRVDHLLYLGLAHQAEGDLVRAENFYRQALALALEIDRREILPHVQYHLADVLRRQGNAEAALEHFTQAANLIEASSTPLRDETLKISLLGRWQQVYEALILHCLELGRVAEAFIWAERARARAFADAFDEAEAGQPVATPGEIQAALPPDATLLCYFTTGVLEQDMPLLAAIPADNPLREHILLPARTLCFVVTRDRIAVRDCPLNPNLFATQSPRGFDVTRFLKTAVRQRLFHDLLNEEVSHSRLIIVPHGPLHRVPFTALFPEAERPLLTFAPSGTIFARQRAAAPKPGRGCLAVGYNSTVENGRFLQYTEAEVSEVGALMDGEVWNGREPKKERLRQEAANCLWLHIACHGWFNDADPLASYLQTGADETLTAREVRQTWRLQARLVTLSACETGLSQILRGDEPMGLVRAFLSVGARAVLVSQWRVDDLATFLLMRRFYQLVGGEELSDFSAALHRAQEWLRQLTADEAQAILDKVGVSAPPDWSRLTVESTPFAAPEFWAGFILVGQ
jgi:tetratricopeptide (TPR) repeat protein